MQVIFNSGGVHVVKFLLLTLEVFEFGLSWVIDDGYSDHTEFPAGKLWLGLFSEGKLGHLG